MHKFKVKSTGQLEHTITALNFEVKALGASDSVVLFYAGDLSLVAAFPLSKVMSVKRDDQDDAPEK